MKAVVVGLGSIGRRHISNLKAMVPGIEVGCVSASGRPVTHDAGGADQVWPSIAAAVSARPDLVIVASPAPWHLEHALAFAAGGAAVLIEKPLTDSYESWLTARDQLLRYDKRITVGYVLRHLPSANVAKNAIDSGRLGQVHSVLSVVGQYLPDWRPGTDYRNNVSARRELGGGVLRELSHELDLLHWLFGPVDAVHCRTSTTGLIDVDVEDKAQAVLEVFGENSGQSVP
jgi:predicted dehydrogenase